MPDSFQVTRQVCHRLSTGNGWVANDVPSNRACTVVPDGQSMLPYHSAMSTSPPRPGVSFNSHQAGQQPAVRQLNFTRASKVWLIPAPNVPTTLPLTYLPSASRVARRTRLPFPSRNTCWPSSRYWPMFSGRSQNTGFLMDSRNWAICHRAGLGGAPAGPLNSSPRNSGTAAAGAGEASGAGGAGGIGPGASGPAGSAPALGVGRATAATLRPAIIIALRRSISGMASNFKARTPKCLHSGWLTRPVSYSEPRQ